MISSLTLEEVDLYDEVICVHTDVIQGQCSGRDISHRVTEGEKYKVVRKNDTYIYIKDDNGDVFGVYPYRFILANKELKKEVW